MCILSSYQPKPSFTYNDREVRSWRHLCPTTFYSETFCKNLTICFSYPFHFFWPVLFIFFFGFISYLCVFVHLRLCKWKAHFGPGMSVHQFVSLSGLFSHRIDLNQVWILDFCLRLTIFYWLLIRFCCLIRKNTWWMLAPWRTSSLLCNVLCAYCSY